ncbi:hypothetical protein B0T10DRAFT_564347 [Thelonectria olida]|uniref:Extracellular membrane protein CFEM domain-containing protein n=1 Tax=Thelonectria olida TaxID=1576542 RepID=A0A9P8VZK3_9HYPO|nr:hypothetical protein B0T10DRAFT_564347 [Thelonectria olida]
MHFTTTFLMAALSGIAFAMPQAAVTDCPQTSAIPTCGVPCISSAASACASSDAVQASALNCVLNNCGLATALSVRDAAAAVCTACA